MFSPTYDIKIFLSKISGKTSDEVLAAAEKEIQSLKLASPKQRSFSLAYLRDLRLLTGYIFEPPGHNDHRGPIH